MTKNLKQRILTCVVGVPAVVAGIFCFQDYNFIIFSLLIIAFAFLGTYEMSKMLFDGKIAAIAYLAPFLTVIQYLQGVLSWPDDTLDLIFILLLLFVFSTEIKLGEKDNFKESLTRASKKCLLIFYPNYLLTFMLRMLALPGTTAYTIITFMLVVFSNDIFAYVFGMLFGKNNKGIFKVSPKKSVAGFIGGLVCCVGMTVLMFTLVSGHLPNLSLFEQILLGIAMSITANIGDLTESAFKRSANVKDSGNLIPGRGGVMDSMDSLIASAPIFFILITMLAEN